MWRKSVQHILALPDLTCYWIDKLDWRGFSKGNQAYFCDDSDQKDINEEYEESTLSEEECYGIGIDSNADDNDFLLGWNLGTIFLT